jgi:hypothetical protein
MKYLIPSIKALGYIWLTLAFLLIIIGSLMVIIQEGLSGFFRLFNPFNILNYLLMFLICTPGFGLLVLADKLEDRQDKF